ncbi:MAG: DUF3179 domain-containing protein [Chloroflexi bacterium]|nr:DUF3179 domain-containing protein [Chloroflexota bacterium]
MKKSLLTSIGLTALATILVACASAATDDVIDLTEETVEEDAAMEGDSESDEAAGNDDEIMTSEEVPPHLRTVTRGWETDFTRHTVDYDEILSGGPPRDGIPSIDEPQFETIAESEAWLAGTEPVIVVEVEDDARAYPLSILTRHEIVNEEFNGVPLAVTFCPLCNSALVFDRRVNGEVYEFGVSGLLRGSDLIMYDRTTESLWQQFTGEGIVGFHAGDQLDFVASSLVSFDSFREAHPEGEVLSRETGIYPAGTYGVNPYVGYDDLSNNQPFLFRNMGEIDTRLPAMLRVAGVNVDGASIAYPYDLLAEELVIQDTFNGQNVVLFFAFGTNSALGAQRIANAEDVGAATVFDPNLNGQTLTFSPGDEDGRFVDAETGTTWNLLGQAIEGELEGEQLERLLSTDHFWFSWAAFFPETDIYSAN